MVDVIMMPPHVREAHVLQRRHAIFIPTLWWHHVESLARYNVLIDYWWKGDVEANGGGDTALNCLLLCPLAPRRIVAPPADSERAALEEPAATDAVRRREIAALEILLRRKAQHAIAPLIGVGLVPELLAARSVDANHVVDVALHLGGAFGRCRAAGDENRQYAYGECTHGCLPFKQARTASHPIAPECQRGPRNARA
jgi:hypothetical protein